MTRRALINHHAEMVGTANPARAGRMLLRLLRAAQPISRVELARRLGVNRSTVTDTFKPLIAAGVVLEDAAAQPAGAARNLGRPPSSLSFNSGRDLFAGVSLGVKRSQVGVATLGGEILAEEEFETPAGAEEALALVRSSVERLCARVHGGRELGLIGVSVPGPVDAERRCLLYAPHLGWQHVPFAEALDFGADGRRVHKGEGIPVVVENNATAAALYESRLKLRGKDSGLMSDFVLVRSGTGIGVGLVIGGEVYRGTGKGAGLAGEFGHMTIVAGGKPCPCGNRGCWERYGSAAAASALYAGDRVQLAGAPPPRFVEIVARAEGGELRARRTLERVGEYLGIGIANVLMGLGVPRVIISGRVVHGWKYIKDPLHEAVGQSMAGRLEGWSVEPGEPQGAGLGGALEVAVEGFLGAGLYA